MKRIAFVLAWAALLATPLAACNDLGDCQGQSVKPGASCSGDQLECPYTLDTPSPACDGTIVEGGLQTSCTCQHGTWSCPSPVSCDAMSAEDASATDASTADSPADSSKDASGDQ